MSDAFVWGVLPKIVTTAIDYGDFGLGQSPALKLPYVIFKFG